MCQVHDSTSLHRAVPSLPWLSLAGWEGGEELAGQCQGVAAEGTFLSSVLDGLAMGQKGSEVRVSQKGSEVRRCSDARSQPAGQGVSFHSQDQEGGPQMGMS